MSNGKPQNKNRPPAPPARPASGPHKMPPKPQAARPQSQRQPAPPPRAQAPSDDEEILIKDASGQFKVLRRGEIKEVALKTSRELIDKIQEEIIHELEKKAWAPAGSSAGTPSAYGRPARTPTVDVFNQEEEAKDVAGASTGAAAAKPVPEYDWSSLADGVIKESSIGLKDPILLSRLKNIVVTQLRGVRKMVDTRLILIRPTQLGGMGFDGTTADKVISALTGKSESIARESPKERVMDQRAVAEFSKIKSTFAGPEAAPAVSEESKPAMQKPAEAAPSAAAPVAPAPVVFSTPSGAAAATAEPARGAETPAWAKNLPRPGGQVPAQVGPQQAAAAPIPSPAAAAGQAAMSPLAQPAAPEKPAKEFEIPVKDFTRPSAAARPSEPGKITDVRLPAQLVGPVQELRMDLIDFRRLSDSPARSAAKIEEKLKNLEQDAFSKKIDGLRAWQSGEVFQVYLLMGLEALRQKVSIDEVITGRQQAQQPVLTKDEFSAVNDLNQRLQF